MNFAEAVKKCSLSAYDASVPCDVVFGVVEGEEPFVIRAGDMILPQEVVHIAEHLLYKDEEIRLGTYERTVVINEGIKEGDTIILLRKRGGESYFAVGKI